MSFRDSLRQKMQAFRRRLDQANRSLAEKALPGDRKFRVSELSLRKKAQDAGQHEPLLRVVENKQGRGPSS